MKGSIGICILLLSFTAHTAEANWSVYQSDNFSLYTDLNDKGARNLLQSFENFRISVLAVMNFPKTDENTRLKVVVYSRPKDYNQIRPSQNVIGFFMPTGSGPRMVIGPSRGANKTEVLYHEYIHHLIQEHVEIPVPRWYNEGFAELLATTEIKGKVVSSGKPNLDRLQSLQVLNPLSLEQLFKPFDEEASSMYMERFYGTSMLFMHFLQVAPLDSELDLRPNLSQFVYRISTGEDPIAAIEPSFGMTPAELSKAFVSYTRKSSFQYLKFEFSPYEGAINQRRLTSNEQASLMADMAIQMGKEDVALAYLKDLDDKQPDAALGLTELSIIENHRNNTELALQLRDKALGLNNTNSEVLANIAHLYYDFYTRSLEENAADESLLDQVLQQTHAALEIDPDNLVAYSFQGLANKAQQRHTDALRSMMAVYQRMPSSISINAEIGDYLFELNRPGLARPFIERVQNWSHDPNVIQQAKNRLDEIDQMLATTE